MVEKVDENEKNSDYKKKLILAPMVRMTTLPLRLLALEYGAGIFNIVI
jgi:tRNA-dihydrouridine synthase 2